MSLFAKRLLEKFKDIKFDPKRFDILKEKMSKFLKDCLWPTLSSPTSFYSSRLEELQDWQFVGPHRLLSNVGHGD